MARSGSTVRTSRFSKKNEEGRYRLALIVAVTTILAVGVVPAVGVITAQAQGAPTPAITGQTGTLKVCKVAGSGVALDTPVKFGVSASGGGVSVTVPAGPAPGGYCEIAGSYALGSHVTVTEPIPSGDQVTSVTSNVPLGPGLIGLGAISVSVNIQAGVTEVTYTDASKQSGFFEICKKVTFAPGVSTTARLFHFTVNGQVFTVPAGACSPAINVPAGTYLVKETPPPTPNTPYLMTGCSTVPTTALSGCKPTLNTVTPPTIKVVGGPISSETILTITNLICSPTAGCPV